MKKNMIIKAFAFLALFWIIIWMIWTWLLVIMWSRNNTSETSQKISEEKLKDLIYNAKNSSWTIEKSDLLNIVWTWIIETNSWEIK